MNSVSAAASARLICPPSSASSATLDLAAAWAAVTVSLQPQDVLAAPTCAGLQRVFPTPALGSAPADAIGKAANLIRQAQRPALLVGSRGVTKGTCLLCTK